jgi:hypothetical protein
LGMKHTMSVLSARPVSSLILCLALCIASGQGALSQTVEGQALGAEELCSAPQGEEVSVPASEEHPLLKLHSLDDHELILVDRGFCGPFLESRSSSVPAPSLSPPAERPSTGGWKIRLYLSHSFTRYFNSDVSFQSSRYNVEIKDYEWAERGSRNFFNPSNWFKNGTNPAQIIDEPTNTFTVSIEKDGNEFYLSAFHPKFIQQQGQVKQMSGTIDGVPVNTVQRVDPLPRADAPKPGESPLVRNEFTYGQMLYEVGYGHRFTLLKSRIGNIAYIPQVGVGVMVGSNFSLMTKPGVWNDYVEKRVPMGLNGYGASVGNRIEFNFGAREKFGIFYENRAGLYQMQSKFSDGTMRFRLGFVGNSVGMKFMLFHARSKRSAPKRSTVH